MFEALVGESDAKAHLTLIFAQMLRENFIVLIMERFLQFNEILGEFYLHLFV